MSHRVHPDSHEYGLADGCERCAEHAENPIATLDARNLNALVERTLLHRFGAAVEAHENQPRSETEAIAMANVLTALERAGKLFLIAPASVVAYLADRWSIHVTTGGNTVNSVNIVGRLVRDPELRHTAGGTAVCSMRIAVDRAGDKGDDDRYGAGFFDVTAFGSQGENCAQYLAKGREVAVSGSLRFSEWDDRETGKKRTKVEINAFSVTFIGGKGDRDDAARPDAADADFAGATSRSTDSDADIPFRNSPFYPVLGVRFRNRAEDRELLMWSL